MQQETIDVIGYTDLNVKFNKGEFHAIYKSPLDLLLDLSGFSPTAHYAKVEAKVSCDPIARNMSVVTPNKADLLMYGKITRVIDNLSAIELIEKGAEMGGELTNCSVETDSTGHDFNIVSNEQFASISAATNPFALSAATGHSSMALCTGDQARAITTGGSSSSAADGPQSIAVSLGRIGKARAAEGGAITLCYYDPETSELKHIRSSLVGENGIEPNTWYRLNSKGEFEKTP